MSVDTIKHCDRCGAVGVGPEEWINWAALELTHSGTHGINIVDLCDECFTELIAFGEAFGRYRQVRKL